MAKMRAFSIMELLTTVCVIAAIVGLLTPLTNKFSKKDKIVFALKEIYETISPAFERYQKIGIGAQYWDWNNRNVAEASESILEKYILPLFPKSTSCKNPLLCVGGYLSMDGEEYTNYRAEDDYARALVGKKNIHIALRATNICRPKAAESLCGVLIVDVDNKDGENKAGYDVFVFGIYGDGTFRPFGYNFSKEKIESGCSKDSSGDTCAAKIMNDNWMMKEVGSDKYPLN